jgi:hypothetical protein
MPNLSQFLPIDIACGPVPRLPTNEQQLNTQSKQNIYVIFVF